MRKGIEIKLKVRGYNKGCKSIRRAKAQRSYYERNVYNGL